MTLTKFLKNLLRDSILALFYTVNIPCNLNSLCDSKIPLVNLLLDTRYFPHISLPFACNAPVVVRLRTQLRSFNRLLAHGKVQYILESHALNFFNIHHSRVVPSFTRFREIETHVFQKKGKIRGQNVEI